MEIDTDSIQFDENNFKDILNEFSDTIKYHDYLRYFYFKSKQQNKKLQKKLEIKSNVIKELTDITKTNPVDARDPAEKSDEEMVEEKKNTQLLLNSVKSRAFLLNRHQALPPEFHRCDLSKYYDPKKKFNLMLFINKYSSKMYLEYGYFRNGTYENNETLFLLYEKKYQVHTIIR